MSRSPVFNVLGSFFPAWLLCLIAAIVLTYVVHRILAILRLEPEMKPLVLVYPSITAGFAFTLWLIFFS